MRKFIVKNVIKRRFTSPHCHLEPFVPLRAGSAMAILICHPERTPSELRQPAERIEGEVEGSAGNIVNQVIIILTLILL